ncbi:MAG TPA: hypothetical protein DEQ64_15935 [Lachnoclostridium sp.]|uniref:hypothetical protein n=1 Tax=Lacrimispora sp. TaxID=2719234 RepID=UPI000ED22AEF|nr:hypothetical protein [Lacrimispora sp.]HCD45188.1 hypothetical protein [Lachnoclostridium sp.]
MSKYMIILGTAITIIGLTACVKKLPNTETVNNVSETTIASLPAITESEATTEITTTEKLNKEFSTEKVLPMLYINGQLYRLLSKQGEPMGDSGCVDGYILSSVDPEEVPTEHEQSNFGSEGNPYCLEEEYGELVAMVADEWLRFTDVDLIAQPVNYDLLTSDLALLGADGIELNYADSESLVFHSYAGLFRCEKSNDNWVMKQSLDLIPLEANATQGDQYSYISADRDTALISPKCYAPDNEIPVTFQYLFAEDKLELVGRFQDYADSNLVWSYSEEAMSIRQKLCDKQDLDGLWISNLYPIAEMNSNVYGFILVGSDGLESIQYGLYWSDLDQLELEPIREQRVLHE